MPFALIFIGLVLIVTGARNTYAAFGSMLVKDLVGDGASTGFVWYGVAVGATGALGVIPELRTFSHYFMALIILSLLLHNASFFQKFVQAIKGAQAFPGASAPTPATTAAPSLPFPAASALGVSTP